MNEDLAPVETVDIEGSKFSSRKVGWYEGLVLKNSGERRLQKGLGAVGLVFSRAAVIAILSHSHMVTRVLDAARGTKAIDGAVVTAMNLLGYREYVHYPSLLQHTGKVSAIGNLPHASAPSFRGEDFDCLSLLKTSHMPTETTHQQNATSTSFSRTKDLVEYNNIEPSRTPLTQGCLVHIARPGFLQADMMDTSGRRKTV